ncbi:hypothetical protein AAE250_12235 [Bacteroides sp. GD17]|uniref:hypothetical protein n=1 Tax=Bacteroides sp. GD17 TaxID=3139826 RepID=UPI00313B4E7E
MRTPTDKEIEDAKEYLRQRLSAELSMRTNLQSVLTEAAKRIIEVSYRYNVRPEQFRFSANRQLQEEVDAIILYLLETIEDYTCTLAVAAHEDNKEAIIAYITRESYEKTFTQRGREYIERFAKEIETAIAAGLLYSITKEKLLSSIKLSIKTPLLNEYVQKAIADGNPIISRLGVQESFGVGRTASSWTALSDLTEYAVAEGWMYHLGLQAKANGALGFFVMRGSSYPCSQCDDEVGFHTEWEGLPPFHGHCKCFAIPIYSTIF